MGSGFKCRLKVFPKGTKSTQLPEQVAAFLQLAAPHTSAWKIKELKYSIEVLGQTGNSGTGKNLDKFTFSDENDDRGFHRGFLKCQDLTKQGSWLHDENVLCLLVEIDARRAQGFTIDS